MVFLRIARTYHKGANAVLNDRRTAIKILIAMEDNAMAINVNQDYSKFYAGTEQLKSYGSNSAAKKDTLVKYQFNTTDKDGNKVMDKMSKEETMKVLNDISSLYGENVIVQFSGDGLAALADSKKFMSGREKTAEEVAAKEAKDAAFQSEIKHFDKSANYLPAYSGMYGADKAIATAVENCSKEEQAFVYDIIRQNFLVGNGSSMTEEERQANISLGMKKAEYAAENFISEDNRKSFLDAMESVAKLASAGKADSNGNIDYGVKKGNYLGNGSNLVYTTDAVDVMRKMDSNAYAEYQKINKEGGEIDSLKYLTNWYANAVKKNPSMIDKYEKQSDEYVDQNVKNQKLDKTFADIKTESKSAFLESLKAFQISNPGFLTSIIDRELALKFWNF